jgi:hypothetical protein|tara:strand:- start:403 stop:576 length:174 start_codon:yes stop_codon:yes gene_type:complete
MKNFKYYFRHDVNKEALGKIKAESINEAIIKAAKKKQLSYDKFLMLFEVEKIDGRKN